MPIYHIVAADSRTARSGKVLEVVGRYEPQQKPAQVVTKEPRVFYWLKHGALPTDTVRSLLQRSGLWLKWSLTKRGKDEASIAAEMDKWSAAQADRSQRLEEKKAKRSAARRKARKTQSSAPATEAPAAS